MKDLDGLAAEIGAQFKSLLEIQKKVDRAARMSVLLNTKNLAVHVSSVEDARFHDAPILDEIFKDIDLKSTALPYIRDRLAELHREIDAEFFQWKNGVNSEVP